MTMSHVSGELVFRDSEGQTFTDLPRPIDREHRLARDNPS